MTLVKGKEKSTIVTEILRAWTCVLAVGEQRQTQGCAIPKCYITVTRVEGGSFLGKHSHISPCTATSGIGHANEDLFCTQKANPIPRV